LPAWPDVPTRVLTGSGDRFFPAEFQRRLARDRLGITPDQMPGGHLLALSRPTEVAERLEGYAAAVPAQRLAGQPPDDAASSR
jgi:pimeloyl-ACP methyl ester carboxylesterase